MTGPHRPMPPPAPLPMPAQNLRLRHVDPGAPATPPARAPLPWRLCVFGGALLATVAFAAVLWLWFRANGISWVEAVLLALMVFNFFWLCLTVATVGVGLAVLARPHRPEAAAAPMSVALLVPIHNEVPSDVLGNARSMLEDLRAHGGAHDYAMFILSDTRDPDIARAEEAAFAALRASLPADLRLYYRRRAENTDRKVGNIADWVRGWGGAWQAMVVLDADSLMTGPAIARLADTLAGDPSAGLIQSFPRLVGAQTVFSRMQQFANGAYGTALAAGLARWSGDEGNYWGHNAILRTAAFAACAGLPRLRGLTGRDRLIMSHDFVEAGLLRRAGWRVRFAPWIEGSFEETPQTLIDHIRRDRRWCQGNLQHLRLLAVPGLRPVSRFHLLHGAVGYLLSPIWFALLIMWALLGRGEEASVLGYFSPQNPLYPAWPEMTEGRHVLVILLLYALLLAPKLMGIAAIRIAGERFADYGGGGRFALSVLVELALSVAYAPIMMVQQTIAVIRTWLGLQRGWAPQARAGGRHGPGALMLNHALETVSGGALMTGILAGLVSPWLLPIAGSLALAVPLSALSGMPLGRSAARLMATREVWGEPQVAQAARHYRKELKRALRGGKAATPAE